MKKLFGVMILAGVPVACGTSLPSSPASTDVVSAADGVSVSSQAGQTLAARIVPGCTTEDTGARLQSIRLTVVESGKGFVRVRAEGITSRNGATTTCFTPTWGSKPRTRVPLSADAATREATLHAASGSYEISARVEETKARTVVGSITVSID